MPAEAPIPCPMCGADCAPNSLTCERCGSLITSGVTDALAHAGFDDAFAPPEGEAIIATQSTVIRIEDIESGVAKTAPWSPQRGAYTGPVDPSVDIESMDEAPSDDSVQSGVYPPRPPTPSHAAPAPQVLVPAATPAAPPIAGPAPKGSKSLVIVLAVIGVLVVGAAAGALWILRGSAAQKDAADAPKPSADTKPAALVDVSGASEQTPNADTLGQEQDSQAPLADAFKAGNTWVFEVQREPEAAGDEGAEHFFVRWTVTATATLEDGTRVADIEEVGGAYDRRVRPVRVTFLEDGCVQLGGEHLPTSTTLCTGAGERQVLATAWGSIPSYDVENWSYAPEIGITGVRAQADGMRTRATLVGYTVDGVSQGPHDLQPVVCDWDVNERIARSKRGKITLSGQHGVQVIRTKAGSDDGKITLDMTSGEKLTFPFDLRPRWLKTWTAPGNAAEYMVVPAANARTKVFVYRFQTGAPTEFVLQPEVADDVAVSVQLQADTSECFLRLEADVDHKNLVADYSIQSPTLARRGGSLNVTGP